MNRNSYTLLFFLLPIIVSGQVDLVKDVFPGFNSGIINNSGAQFKVWKDHVYFEGRDASGGELWRTDGTNSGTQRISDISPDGEQAFISHLTPTDNFIFFTAEQPDFGEELWRSDGSVAGTIRLTDIDEGTGSSIAFENPLLAAGDRLFFFAGDFSPSDLWVTDGTIAGTTMVKSFFSVGSQFIAYTNSKVYFTMDDDELWESDGTEEGTTKIENLPFVELNAVFNEVNGAYLFHASTTDNGYELWKTDGTEGGTTIVKDIAPGSDSSFTALYNAYATLNGELYFVTHISSTQQALWKSDGTEEGTVKVADLPAPGELMFNSPRVKMAGSDTRIFFAIPTEANGVELWKTDGTEEGTELIIHELDGTMLNPIRMAVLKNWLYFNGNSGGFSRDLFVSDGTASGTMIIDEFDTGSFGSVPNYLTVLGDQLIFNAQEEDTGGEVYVLTPLNVSVDETALATLDVQVFPNPADESFQLSIKGENLPAQNIYLTDVLGRRLSPVTKNNARDLSISTSHLPVGIYQVVIDLGHARKAFPVAILR